MIWQTDVCDACLLSMRGIPIKQGARLAKVCSGSTTTLPTSYRNCKHNCFGNDRGNGHAGDAAVVIRRLAQPNADNNETLLSIYQLELLVQRAIAMVPSDPLNQASRWWWHAVESGSQLLRSPLPSTVLCQRSDAMGHWTTLVLADALWSASSYQTTLNVSPSTVTIVGLDSAVSVPSGFSLWTTVDGAFINATGWWKAVQAGMPTIVSNPPASEGLAVHSSKWDGSPSCQ